MTYIPNHLEADEHSQNKHDKVLHETCRCISPDDEHQNRPYGQHAHLLFGGFFKCGGLGG